MCTLQRRGDIFILTITGDDEHRLNPILIDSIRVALNRAKSESESMGPTALITTAQGKFFSNGYDLSWSRSDPDPARVRAKSMSRKFRLLVAELISLPMPTIAAVTGHASAAGFILALSHDYLLMRKDRGFLYMSELDIRNVVLKAEKITAAVGVEWGIVDSAHENAAETVEAAVRLGMDLVSRKWDGNVYADNRRTVFADILVVLGSDESVGDTGDNVDEKIEGGPFVSNREFYLVNAASSS
ncbi:hypothetical protein DH2020_037838 [Rehmannia glutinosa]|uniref:Uncharacterized protein n=1 Tax=Rehmannia glutinosa TaxID=99300 RepID=A0ABR0V325_REHGL